MANVPAISKELLASALIGLEMQKRRIDDQIAEIRSLLGKRGPGRPRSETSIHGTEQPQKRGRFSRAARSRMAQAQRERWAKVKGDSTVSEVGKTTKKRSMSPEGRKRIADAAKKRWAAYRKEQQA